MANTTEESIALSLANRAFGYALLHTIFSGAPTQDTLSAIFSNRSKEFFQNLKECYSLGAAAKEADKMLGSSKRTYGDWVSEAPSCIAVGIERLEDESFLDELKSDYVKLLKVPGDSFVHPWESAHIGKETMIFQESTVDVRSFYHKAGLKLVEEKKFPDDHIGAMMDYLAQLASRAYESFADGDDAACILALNDSKLFIGNHLVGWIDKFTSKLVEKDARGFYASLAAAMSAYIHSDYIALELLVNEIDALA